jgi:RHS repeat-associated protein
MGCTYSPMDNANPDAVTQIATGYSTSSLSYDADGNLIQKTVDGTTTTYLYDYANRLIALGVGGATTTYGYDWAGNRVSQTGTTTTYLYPFKWYSVASSTGSGAKYATTTDYVFNGDTLLATVDQQTASGNATGTAKTRYVHPDHLGSTNVVTDENDNVVQTLDYYPYGSTRISTATSTRERRQYIGQFADDSSLSYLNARYYEGSRGQFLSQDPIFLGDPKQQTLQDPQSLNVYSFSEDNPITKSDPNGKLSTLALAPVYYLAPEELLAGPIGWSLLGLTVIGSGIVIAVNTPKVQPTAPGIGPLRESMVQNAHSSDFQMGGPIGKPLGNWGPLITTAIGTGLTAYGGCVLLNCDLDYGRQASPQSGVSGVAQLPKYVSSNTSGSISWNSISYSRNSALTQTELFFCYFTINNSE